jgi:hypothetical protein
MSPPQSSVDSINADNREPESIQADSEPSPGDRPDTLGWSITVDDTDWKPFASFTVQFQTRQIADQVQQWATIQHQETGATETCDSVDLKQLHEWMLAQVQPALPVSLEPAVPETTIGIDGRPRLAAQIMRVQVVQPAVSESPIVVSQPGQIFSSSIKSGEAFNLEVAFNVRQSSPDQPWIGQQHIRCSVRCYARHRSSRIITALETTTADLLIQGEASYTATLSGAVLKQAGSYRLQVLVTLESALATPGYFEIPVLQVV